MMAASMACSMPFPLAGSRSKTSQSASSSDPARDAHMWTVRTDICASQRNASGESTMRCLAVPLFVVRVGVSTVVSHGGASLPRFW